jgi:hypothetical protein
MMSDFKLNFAIKKSKINKLIKILKINNDIYLYALNKIFNLLVYISTLFHVKIGILSSI